MDSTRKISPRLNNDQRPAPSEADRKKPTPIQMARTAHLASTHLTRPAGTNKIDTRSLPDQPPHGNAPPLTVDNLRYVLTKYGITARYNVIKKDVEIVHPDHVGTIDNALNVTEAKIVSLVAAHGMSTTHVGAFLVVIADENPFNPAADWILSKPWDGTDRLPDFYETLQVEEGYDTGFRDILMRKWLLSATAAALLKTGFKTRGVLTLQGAQGIGKTSWLKSLVPDPALADSLVKLDHHLDGGSKDSILTAIRHWLVEIGELGSTFRRDVERLKGILTNDIDKVRQPYAKQDSTYPRRTVFIATVNDDTFLVDGTGNRRWWTIRVASINYAHGIDMQQVFAQMAQALDLGEVWWLDAAAEEQLDAINRQHMASSVVRDLVLSHIDHDVKDRSGSQTFTPTELLKHVQISNPTNAQVKECAQLLRELFGDPKRIRGSNKWRVPLLKTAAWHDDYKRSEAGTPQLPEGKSKFD